VSERKLLNPFSVLIKSVFDWHEDEESDPSDWSIVFRGWDDRMETGLP